MKNKILVFLQQKGEREGEGERVFRARMYIITYSSDEDDNGDHHHVICFLMNSPLLE